MFDSGASHHISPDKNDFTEYHPYNEPEIVTTADNKSNAVILGEGIV